jgi:hypothetical protein
MLMQRKYAKDGVTVTHVLVKHTGVSAEQNFSHRLVEDGMAAGWIAITDDKLKMLAQPERLVYTLKREPGYYCISTGERIPVSARSWASANRGTLARAEAQAWLKSKRLKDTDYEVTNAYECVLDAGQHDKFHAVVDAKGRITGNHTLEA